MKITKNNFMKWIDKRIDARIFPYKQKCYFLRSDLFDIYESITRPVDMFYDNEIFKKGYDNLTAKWGTILIRKDMKEAIKEVEREALLEKSKHTQEASDEVG